MMEECRKFSLFQRNVANTCKIRGKKLLNALSSKLHMANIASF